MHNGHVNTQSHGGGREQRVRGAARPGLWRLPPSAFVLLLATALVALAFSVPVPFVIFSPGPTFDVLGSQGGDPVLQISGTERDADLGEPGNADSGKLWLTTISERGGPGSTITTADMARAWLTPGVNVYRYSDIYPPYLSADQASQVTQAQMDLSHWTASVAALETLGYEVPAKITIVGVDEDLGAAGLLEPGDRLLAITAPDGTRHPADSPSAPFALLSTIPPGTPVQVEVERDGKREDVTVVTTPDPAKRFGAAAAAPAGSKLGVVLDLDIDMPVDIDFHLDSVGGPSAGMIFALGIIDKMSDADLTGGQQIAGTGGVSYEGTITPIGGITQKMFGARGKGVEWFLAPTGNCDQVVGNVPKGLEVFPVSTLDEAVSAAQSIADGDTDALPTCDAVLEAADGA